MTSKKTPPAAAVPTAKMSAKQPNHPWIILIVDDEVDVLGSLKKLAERSLPDVKVITATSGRKGLEILERERVDLVMSDFKMPGMDGIEFLVQARRIRPAVPRIMFTAFADKDLAHRAVSEAVVNDFFAKNLSPNQMVDGIQALLRYNPEPPSDGDQP